jgi:hypothetical protein
MIEIEKEHDLKMKKKTTAALTDVFKRQVSTDKGRSNNGHSTGR